MSRLLPAVTGGVLLLASVAFAHDHWINENNLIDPASHEICCNERDCQPEKVKEVVGGYLVQTGEIIPATRVIWRSRDGLWWRCNKHQNGRDVTRCLIGPPPRV